MSKYLEKYTNTVHNTHKFHKRTCMPFTPRVNEYRIQCYIFCPVNKINNMQGFSFHTAAGYFGHIL